ncbi:core-binding factor subunit beta isoform X2 [Notamacropus eugenii]|uniref:core-binding factor subunit beta isoform X2 n=1 Tax=Notamacropus eugenii TaxID=9315 RepID=UPI003B66BF59
MPRVVPDQKSKFENEEFFRKLSRECEIKYTGFRDRPHEERQARFQNACRDGRSEIAFVATGTNLSLQFFPASWQGEQRQTPSREYVDLEREAGKVYLKAPMILNGVCVIWKGWIDLQRLDGMGCLEFDEERAQQEDALAQQAFEEARRRTREFEDRDRSHREEMEIIMEPLGRQYHLVLYSTLFILFFEDALRKTLWHRKKSKDLELEGPLLLT